MIIRTKVELGEMSETEGYLYRFWRGKFYRISRQACGTSPEELREIAHRCNVHDELLSLAREYRAEVARNVERMAKQHRPAGQSYLDQIDATLAKAEGRAEASEAEGS
jgi:hypothetical protein